MENFLNDIDVRLPIIQAPMAGGATSPKLVSAIAVTGALGSLAGGMLSPKEIMEAAEAIREKTSKPFMINLFVLTKAQSTQFTAPIPQWINELYSKLGIPAQSPSAPAELFEKQFSALLEVKPKVASFTFGILNDAQVAALKSHNIKIIGTANHPKEAIMWQEIGADAICVQGSEAGGHRGGFEETIINRPIALMPLMQMCRNAVDLPLIATGGLMNGQSLAAIMNLGAVAGQFGTAFLTTNECGISQTYKTELLKSDFNTFTRHTKLFSGKPARGIINKFMEDYCNFEDNVPPYPQQNAYTQPIRKWAAKENNPDYLSLWAGEGVSLCRDLSAAQLIAAIMAEFKAASVK